MYSKNTSDINTNYISEIFVHFLQSDRVTASIHTPSISFSSKIKENMPIGISSNSDAEYITISAHIKPHFFSSVKTHFEKNSTNSRDDDECIRWINSNCYNAQFKMTFPFHVSVIAKQNENSVDRWPTISLKRADDEDIEEQAMTMEESNNAVITPETTQLFKKDSEEKAARITENKITNLQLFLYKDRITPLKPISLLSKFSTEQKEYDLHLTESELSSAKFITASATISEPSPNFQVDFSSDNFLANKKQWVNNSTTHMAQFEILQSESLDKSFSVKANLLFRENIHSSYTVNLIPQRSTQVTVQETAPSLKPSPSLQAGENGGPMEMLQIHHLGYNLFFIIIKSPYEFNDFRLKITPECEYVVNQYYTLPSIEKIVKFDKSNMKGYQLELVNGKFLKSQKLQIEFTLKQNSDTAGNFNPIVHISEYVGDIDFKRIEECMSKLCVKGSPIESMIPIATFVKKIVPSQSNSNLIQFDTQPSHSIEPKPSPEKTDTNGPSPKEKEPETIGPSPSKKCDPSPSVKLPEEQDNDENSDSNDEEQTETTRENIRVKVIPNASSAPQYPSSPTSMDTHSYPSLPMYDTTTQEGAVHRFIYPPQPTPMHTLHLTPKVNSTFNQTTTTIVTLCLLGVFYVLGFSNWII